MKRVMIMATKQNIQAIDAWNRENTDLIRIRARKEEHINERIEIAISQGKAKSRQAYIIEAVKKALEADGIPEISESDT